MEYRINPANVGKLVIFSNYGLVLSPPNRILRLRCCYELSESFPFNYKMLKLTVDKNIGYKRNRVVRTAGSVTKTIGVLASSVQGVDC